MVYIFLNVIICKISFKDAFVELHFQIKRFVSWIEAKRNRFPCPDRGGPVPIPHTGPTATSIIGRRETDASRHTGAQFKAPLNFSVPYKVFQLPQNINDEWDNQGNNYKFFVQNINRKEVNYGYTLFYLCFIQRLLNYYPNYSSHRLYFGEVETSYWVPMVPRGVNLSVGCTPDGRNSSRAHMAVLLRSLF